MLKKLKNAEKVNSRKSVRQSAVPVPCLRRLCLKLREQGSGNFLLLAIEIWALRLGFGP